MCGGPALAVVTPEPVPDIVPDAEPNVREEDKPETAVNLTEWVGRIKADAELRNGPGANHGVIGRIQSNTKVNLILSGGEWLEVIVPGGVLSAEPVRGYINKANIELVR